MYGGAAHGDTWHAERQKGIGGSDIAAILGLSPWRTAYDVWLDKIGEGEPADENNPLLYWGTVLEDVVAKEYQTRTGRRVQRVNRQLVHPELSFVRANIDRAVVNPEIAGNVRWKGGRLTTDRLLECKTAGAYTASKWGAEGTDDIPPGYLLQTQWYAGLAQASVVDLAVLIGGNDYRMYEIAANGDLYADLLAAASEFWTLVENRTPPDAQSIEDARRMWPQHIAAKTEIVGAEAKKDCALVNSIKDEIKRLDGIRKEAELRLMKLFGDAEEIVCDGDRLGTWKTQTAKRIDPKALREKYPDIAAEVETEASTRVLRISQLKDK